MQEHLHGASPPPKHPPYLPPLKNVSSVSQSRHRHNFVGVTKTNPCPVCGKDHACKISLDKLSVMCLRIKVGARHTLRNGMGWMHYLGDSSRPLSLPPSSTPKLKKKIASYAVLNRVYRALLEALPLDKADRDHLRGPTRQLSPAQIKRGLYRTLPIKGRSAVCKTLLRQFDQDMLLQVPGFFWSNKGRSGGHLTIKGAAGLLIPCQDIKGRIVSLQVRPHSNEGSKYLWISSKDNNAPTTSGPGPGDLARYPAHIAQPEAIRDKRIWITEGPLKSTIAAHLLNAVVIGVPGVTQWEGAQVPALCEELDAERVVVAYDADGEQNSNVKGALRNLAGNLVARDFKVEIAQWNLNQGKGIDDLLLAGGTPEFMSWTQLGGSRLVKIDAPAKSEKTSSLDEARQGHLEAVRAALMGSGKRNLPTTIGGKPGTQLMLESDTGTGKTYAVFEVLREMFQSGRWPWKGTREMRIAFVTDTKAQIESLLQDEQVHWLQELIDTHRVVVRYGRDEKTCHPAQLDRVRALGEQRQLVNSLVCSGCPFKAECLYQETLERAKKARLTIATKDALFTNAAKLREYDVIIIDEDILTRCLFDLPVIKGRNVREWLDTMSRLRGVDPGRYDEQDPLKRLCDLLAAVVAQPLEPYDMRPLLAELRRVAGDGDALNALVTEAAQLEPDRYEFEQPYGSVIPLRAMKDLLSRLVLELDRSEEADTRLWVSKRGIEIYNFRDEALSILRRRVLISLDATPAPIVHSLCFPNATRVRFRVPAPAQVTQITDSTLTKSSLKDEQTQARVHTALEAICAKATAPTIFVPKRFNPDAGGTNALKIEGAVYGHYGRDNRALNDKRFMEADTLILVSTPRHPPNVIRAQVQAIRDSETPVPQDGPTERLKPYDGYTDEQGQGRARRLDRQDPDPDVNNALDHQVNADIVQAIGRARAAMRNEGELSVMLLTAYPISGLQVNILTTLHQLAGTPRGGNLATLNAHRAAECEKRFTAALVELEASEEQVTRKALLEKAGGSARDASKALNRRKELSMGHGTNDPFNNTLSTLIVGTDSHRATDFPPKPPQTAVKTISFPTLSLHTRASWFLEQVKCWPAEHQEDWAELYDLRCGQGQDSAFATIAAFEAASDWVPNPYPRPERLPFCWTLPSLGIGMKMGAA